VKKYDFQLAKKIIERFVDLGVLEEASLGLHEDWFWTAQTVWKEGSYTHPLPSNMDAIYEEYKKRRKKGMSLMGEECAEFQENFIGGLIGSTWATPVIQLDMTDGTIATFRCYISNGIEVPITEKISKEMYWTQGCLSSEVREWRDENINIGDFKDPKDESEL
jgi:hypothetical protein